MERVIEQLPSAPPLQPSDSAREVKSGERSGESSARPFTAHVSGSHCTALEVTAPFEAQPDSEALMASTALPELEAAACMASCSVALLTMAPRGKRTSRKGDVVVEGDLVAAGRVKQHLVGSNRDAVNGDGAAGRLHQRRRDASNALPADCSDRARQIAYAYVVVVSGDGEAGAGNCQLEPTRKARNSGRGREISQNKRHAQLRQLRRADGEAPLRTAEANDVRACRQPINYTHDLLLRYVHLRGGVVGRARAASDVDFVGRGRRGEARAGDGDCPHAVGRHGALHRTEGARRIALGGLVSNVHGHLQVGRAGVGRQRTRLAVQHRGVGECDAARSCAHQHRHIARRIRESVTQNEELGPAAKRAVCGERKHLVHCEPVREDNLGGKGLAHAGNLEAERQRRQRRVVRDLTDDLASRTGGDVARARANEDGVLCGHRAEALATD
eukprot:5260112-Pleurochrysis_carterae.AAC.4